MAKTRLVKNNKGQYGVYDPYTDQVTPITSDMSLVKNSRGKYGFKSGNEIIELDETPKSVNLEETFKKKVATASSSATGSTGSTSDLANTEEDPKKQLAAKDQAKQQENQRYIDVFGLGRLDYSGLQKFGSIGEFAADALDVPANLSKAFVRGVSSGRVNQAILDYAKEGGNLDSDMIARLVKENATKTGSVYLDALQKKGILQTDDMSAAGGIAEVILESLGSMAGAYKAGFQGAVAGGSAGMFTGAAAGAIGGPVGSVVGGAVSTTGGAVAGFTGMTSYANEYGASIIQALTKKGYDLTNAKQIEAALKDKSVMDDAKEIANQRGLIIGGIDAMTAGIAGKGAQLAVKIAKRSAIQAGKEITKAGIKRVAAAAALGIEASGGSIGEAAAQLNAEGKITDMDAVALEGIAEIGNAGPTGLYAAYKAGQINSDLNQGNLTKIEELKKAKEALPDENQATKKALDNKISSLEKENKERNKSMTSALQVAPVPATKRVIELTDAITDIESTLEAIKDGTRTDISQEARKAMWDSMNDMIAERDEIRQEMLKANENEAAINMAPEKPMKPVIFIGENKEKVDNNNATVMSPNRPLETVKVEEPITFAEKISDEKGAKPGVAYNVSQGNNIFGTIVESDNNGEKQFILAETGKKYASLDDAKFALQEKLTGQRVSEKERTGIDRVKVEGNLANQKILIGDPANNNQLGLESKGAIQRAVRAMRSVSNANVYLYSNTEDYEKGIAHASGGDTKAVTGGTNAQVVDANGENSIHINLEKADGTTISHEVFHGALLGLAKKDPNAFVTMRDKILDRISEKQNLSVTDETGNKRKVSAKEYLMDFQKRYEGSQYTEADRAEEFLSELAGLMSVEDSAVVKDKSLLDSIKLTIKDVLKKFNVEFDSLNELQDTEDLVQFFKDFNRSVKTGEAINLSRVEGIQGTAPAATQTATQPTAQTAPTVELKTLNNGVKESAPIRNKDGDKTSYMKLSVLKNGDTVIQPLYKSPINKGYEKLGSLSPISFTFPKTGMNEFEFNSHYGVDINEFVTNQNSKLESKYKGKGVTIKGASIMAEVIKPDGTKQVHIKFAADNSTSKGRGSVQEYIDEFIDVPKLRYANEFGISTDTQPIAQPATQPTAKAEPKIRPAKFRVTKSGGKIYEPTTVLKVKIEKDGKLVDQNIVAKTTVDKNGKTTTNFETKYVSKYYEDPRYKRSGIYYNSERSFKENAGTTGRNGEGFKSIDDFESDYGISLNDLIKNHGIKIKDNQYIHHLALDVEEIQTHLKSKEPLYYIKGHLEIRKIGSKPSAKNLSADGVYIGTYVPKLKYTDAITGISTAKPEAGAVKESATTRSEGAKKKESVAKIISGAADKAKPSVKVKAEPAKGKKTVGNTVKISERVAKVTGEIYQASLIEPTNAREMALQYFIRGGTVLRGNTTNGAKPKPHTLVTLFTRSRPGMYYSDKAEMEARLQLYRNGTLTMSEVAHKLWESQENQNLQLDSQEIQNALEQVIMDHKSSAGMAKEMIETRGTPSQKAFISGDSTFAGMDDYEIMTWQHAAQELGVDVEELIANPDKYIKPETLDGMYDDMLSAFEILDKIQDEDAIKQYLEISAPEDLFLDELVAEAAKPEKTLQEKKDDLEKQIKAKKKELAAANKAKKEMGGIGQTSLVEGVQTTIVAPDTMSLYGKIRNLKGEIEDLNSQLGKVESAIEFKERKTIDAFADVVEQKAEEVAVEAGITNPAFFKKDPSSGKMVVDVDKIKAEKPLAYEFLSKYSNFKEFDENGIRNSLAIAYNKMMKFRAGAENLLAQISELEDIAETTTASNTTTKDKFKADAKLSGDFNDAQLEILNEVVDSLNTELMPEYNSSENSLNHIGVDAGEHPNFYIFQENILASKDPAAFIHEVGHFSFYNILSKQDRLEFLSKMIESTYGNKGKSLSSRLAMTSEKTVYKDAFRTIEYNTNVGDNFSEYFAEQFRQWYVGKNLAPTQFDTIFEKVEKFIQKLIDKLKSGEYIDQSLVKYFEKISNAKEAAKVEVADNESRIKALEEKIAEYKSNIKGTTVSTFAYTERVEGSISQDIQRNKELKNKIAEAEKEIEVLKNGEKSKTEATDKIEPKGKVNKFTLPNDNGGFASLFPNPPDTTYFTIDENGDVFLDPSNGDLKMAFKMDSYIIDTMYNAKYANNVSQSERQGVVISKLPKVDKDFNLISKGELTYTDKAGVSYDIKEFAKAEPVKAELSKNEKEIKSIEAEIEQYEREIEDATEEIENTKNNYREAVDEIKAEKKELAASSLDKQAKADHREELDARLEDAADERDTYIEQYKDTIAEAKKEIKALQKKIDKLKTTTKSQISGERVAPFLKADPTYKYQMSGTEASLKLIDNIRSKYKMQNTAEEMGIVSKGVRATEKIISDNVVTRVFGGASAAIYKRFANDRANKFVGKPLAMLQSYIADNVRKGLSSENTAAANASAITVGLIQNLGSTEDFQYARNELNGGKSVAKNELWQLGKCLNDMINQDKLALRRVHSLLDPEAFEGITDATLPSSKADLSFAELRLFNALRDMNDYIHEWHYKNGFLGEGEAADALYQKNKGSYFARMYKEIEDEKFGQLYDALSALPNAADFTMFKERKDFTDVKNKFTLKEDPIYITTKRFGQMMQNQAILQFCDYVAKSGDYQIYDNREDIPAGALKAGNYRRMPYGKNGGKAYGELTGKLVPDIVAQQLIGIEFSNQVINLTYQAAKVFDKTFARQVLSKLKTTWNPLTRAGNITMNFVFASLAGVDPVTLLKNRPAAKESLDTYDSYARDLDANGLLGVSMGKELNNEKDTEAKRILSEKIDRNAPKFLRFKRKQTIDARETPVVPQSKLNILGGNIKRVVSNLDQMLTDSYGKSDDVAKVALYKSLVDDYGKTREEAIKIVASSMQNYNTVGKAYDYASKSVNRFVKFKADSARILYNSFKDRPLNLMATLGMYLAAQALASKMSGEDEEERKIREERPYTNKIKIGPVNISLTMKFGDTEVNVARYLAPYSMYDAGYDSNTFKDMSTYLPLQYDEHTFIAINDPLIGPLVNLANDTDFRGMPISDPGKTAYIGKTVTDNEALWNRVAFAGRNFAAPYWGWGENIYAAATGNSDYYGRTRSMSEAMLNTVIKVQTVNNETLQRTYEGALRKLDRDVDDAGKTISHKANALDLETQKYSEREGVSLEQIDKFTAKQEQRLINFTLEQQDLIDKKILEMQKVEGTLGKLQQIQQRKQQ